MDEDNNWVNSSGRYCHEGVLTQLLIHDKSNALLGAGKLSVSTVETETEPVKGEEQEGAKVMLRSKKVSK